MSTVVVWITPPLPVPPDGIVANTAGFKFDSYGVRVSAAVISPYIPPGSQIRPGDEATLFDHFHYQNGARIVCAGRARSPQRDAAAPSLVKCLRVEAPNNDGPPMLTSVPAAPVLAQLKTRAAAAPNGMQAGIATAVASLPTRPPASQEDLPGPAAPDPNAYATVPRAQGRHRSYLLVSRLITAAEG